MDRVEYILTRKANGDARTAEEIGAEYDALAASLAPPAPEPAALAAAVQRAEAVNAWLEAKKPGADATAAELAAWEELRRLPFKRQAELAGL